jgi:hypothetical protein
MAQTINRIFATRRDADLAVEHLVQEFGIERTDIFVAPEGDANTSGVDTDGADNESAAPSPGERSDGAHNGAIAVSVDVNDDEMSGKIARIFDELGGQSSDNR